MEPDKKFSKEQLEASNPSDNIWVQANAGTGKTKVLVHRLLRILFRNGQYDDKLASGILCLTYTNAAAGEMRNRVLDELHKWASATDEQLSELLESVSANNPPTAHDLELARKVFYIYIDNPNMLKIKTIHGFCEEILHRFPIEAGISPTWSLISGAPQTVLLDQAFNRMVKNSVNDISDVKNTMNAFYKIIDIRSEYFLNELRELLLAHYRSFFQVEDVSAYREYFINTIADVLNVKNPLDMSLDIKQLTTIINYAKQLEKASKKPAQYILNIINTTQQYIDNTINFEKYKELYLTKENEIAKKFLQDEVFKQEAFRVYEIQQYLLNKDIFQNTVALFDLSMNFANEYKKIKQEHNLLDFEDLILYTQKLFEKPDVMGWVLSQMDVSLSHILVDEAQDTSPGQWNILRALAGDFFAEGDTANNRSLFVVGDTKQSIYGFQNADPRAFAASRQAIADQIKNNYRTIKEVSLDQSFRSTKPILDTVDCFFDCPDIIKETDFYNNKHKCHRINAQGLVEIHNTFKCDETGTAKNKLYVNMLADKIEHLVRQENVIPKDIMILVQKRSAFVDLLSTALKKRGIDIAGNDRIKLPEFSAIKDMLHLIRFCTDNKNDYSLCCVLKSPFYKLKERDIFNICKIKNSDKSLTVFDVLKDVYPDVYNDLSDMINQSKSLAPYSFFTYVLNKNNNRQKIISALGKHVIDPIEEFLTMCLAYERTQPGTLYHFLKWFITGDSEIKRDMDASQGVRIMTVHGSKGLGSKIVFLIDTLTFPKPNQILNINHLHQNNKYDVWLWKTGTSAVLDPIIEKNKQDDISEYYRLLYVAMTRAKDDLYIYGCDMDRANEMVWHKQLWNVFGSAKELFINEDTIRITNDTKLENFFDWCKE
jgi:ATP-dependent helicase/nuclease subunit A